MKATVNTNLNIRTGQPSVNAPCYGYLKPGDQIDYVDTVHGDKYDGNDRWLKGGDGNYYWSGGVTMPSQPAPNDSGYVPQWMLELNIPDIWTKATGRGVGVAIVDTGIDLSNTDLPFDKNKFFEYTGGKLLQDLQDKNSHGTHCAGLVGARNKGSNRIGVAPQCNLFVCKITENGYFDTDKDATRYSQAIRWCAEQDEIHVISISCATQIKDPGAISDLQDAISKAVLEKNKTIVCATGDATGPNESGLMYPACLDNTIVVGSPPVDNVLYSYVNRFLVTTTNGNNIESYDNTGSLLALTGTSQSNAIIAGIIALMIEHLHFNYKPSLLSDCLKNASVGTNYDGVILPVLDKDKLLNCFNT